MTSSKPVANKPLKFKTIEDLQCKIDSYFKSCYITKVDEEGNKYQENIRPLTISGLAYDLDTTRRTLLDYEAKDGYSHTIRKAKARIESFTEESLYKPKVAQGVIFSLKNNYAWADRQEIVTTNNNITVSLDEEE